MKSIVFACLLAAAVGRCWIGQAEERDAPRDKPLPARWQTAWENPPAGDRPLQIVHGIDPRYALPEGIEQILQQKAPVSGQEKGMRFYVERGLGGVVCNVAFDDYLRSEKNWQVLVSGVRQCEKLGLVVWLYDEKGYPSGAAGGLVLQENGSFEATELAYDSSRPDPFVVRPAYEHTHASNNYHAARRYANLIDADAVRCFIEKTHAAYWGRLQPYFGKTIQAMFTDEPSLIAIDLGMIPEAARSRVPVVDVMDPHVANLPCVPWVHDLPEQYRRRYGEDLLPVRRSLFASEAPEDRKVRRQFWSLIADLIADRYFGALQNWCSKHGIASSGHTLWEEALLHHVPLQGNGLKALSRMDIPGLDMLSSDPQAVIHSGWLTAALPCSATRLTGRRRVMTEVSDFSQKMGGAGPAGLADMQATAAWQAAWGVTEFTLYYGLSDRSADTYRSYCDYVGRLNAVLKPARPTAHVLLYYPVHDLWGEYRPVAGPLKSDSQSPLAQKIVASFLRLGRALQRNQIPFTLVDHEWLAAGSIASPGRLAVGQDTYQVLLMPEGSELPEAAARVVSAFGTSGGRVLADRKEIASLIEELPRTCRMAPPSERIAVGTFVRDTKPILLVVNVGQESYEGQISGLAQGVWWTLDPASRSLRRAEQDSSGRMPLKLTGKQSLLLVLDP